MRVIGVYPTDYLYSTALAILDAFKGMQALLRTF